MSKKQVKETLTLSKYFCGRHHFNPKGRGDPSFEESMAPILFMLKKLYKKGVKLGSKIEVTMKVTN